MAHTTSTLSQMTPSFARENLAYCAWGDSKALGYDLLRYTSKRSYLLDLIFSQFSLRILFTDIVRKAVSKVSAFSYHIVNVVHLSSQKKMVWTATRRIVAAMKHLQSTWDRPIVQYPRSAMSEKENGFSRLDNAVTSLLFSSSPQPTRIGYLDLLPKAFNECVGKALRRKKVTLIVRPLDQFHRLLVGSCSRVLVHCGGTLF